MATTVFTLPTQSYPSGTTNVPSTGVQSGVSKIIVTIDISQMLDPATSFDLAFDVSYDNGNSWAFWAGGHRIGGPLLIDRFGNPMTTAKLIGPFSQPTNAQTQIRGTIVVVGPISIGGTVAVE